MGDSGFKKTPATLLLLVWVEGDRAREGTDGTSFELEVDLRRFLRSARLIRCVVLREDELASESESELDEPLDELDEFSMSARTPGWDSSSIRCCGVLSYI
jgi:hypothetical protein